MMVIPGPASLELGGRIASEMGVEASPVGHRLFPDGESYIRMTGRVEGEAVVIVQTTAPEQDRRLMQAFMMAETARDLGAERVALVAPYLAYSRQDKRFLEGECLTLDVVMGLIECVGVDDLIAIDAHSEASLRAVEEKHNVRVHNLSAMPLIAEHLKGTGFDGAYSLSPDVGAIHQAEAAARVLGGGCGFFEKERDRKTGEIRMRVEDLDIEGRNAVVFDDIISSGGTMAKAVEGLKGQGASRVAAACTHALLMDEAEERIRNAGADVILATDTVSNPFSGVSVAGLVADYIRSHLNIV